MSSAHHRTPRPVETIDDAVAVLREGGGRVSTARRAILSVLFGARGPLSTEEIANSATPTLDLPATYRNLDHLEELGLIRHVHVGHGPGLYELVGQTEHELALCETCNRTFSFDPAALDEARAAIAAAIGLVPRFSHFPLVGCCADCRET